MGFIDDMFQPNDVLRNKQVRAELAKKHTEEMDNKYKEEINLCVQNTIIYSELEDNFHMPQEVAAGKQPGAFDYILEDLDSVSAAYKYFEKGKKLTILNFASFRTPGGLFMNGSSAQEECLCHESFFYNVLRKFKPNYYNINELYLNDHLYKNCSLYSSNIIFERNDKAITCDVLTCAAPNKNSAQKYAGVTDEHNFDMLKSRIHFLLEVAAEQKVDTLILGAFGCGVFKQNPAEVAAIFMTELLYDFHDCFKKVVFAIPDRESVNYKEFSKVFVPMLG